MPNPLLQYQFNTINNGQVTDFGSGLKTTVQGNCTLVADPVMGNCLQFDGSSGYLSLENVNFNFSAGITVTCWVNFDKFTNLARIFDFADGTPESNLAFYLQGDSNQLSFQNCIGSSCTYLTTPGLLGTNEWLHIAFTVDTSGNATIYIDGIQAITQKNLAFLPQSINRTSNFIGKSNWAGNALLQGKLAWFSMYGEALSQDDILQDMNQALIERGAFRSSFPVDFELNTNHQGTMAPVIFLESTSNPETLFLTVQNKCNTTIIPALPQSHTPDANNFHFQLKFRPGVLSPKFISAGKVTVRAMDGNNAGSWQAVTGTDSEGNNYISLLATGATMPQLKAFCSNRFSIEGIQADPKGGARTTNAEFFYRQLTFSNSSATIQGSRIQHLDIINHIGQKNIPLHVDVVGSTSILNDGKTPNQVFLRLVNTSDKDIQLSAENPATTFTVTVSGQPENSLTEWALSETDNLQNIQLHWNVVALTSACNNSNNIPLSKPLVQMISQGTALHITPPGNQTGNITVTLAQDCQQGSLLLPVQSNETVPAGSFVSIPLNGQPSWLAPATSAGPDAVSWSVVNANQEVLKAGQSLTLLMTNIITGLKSGLTSVNIGYRNVPGYWDGNFIVNLEKSPLTTRNNQVGIGNNSPQYALDVNGLVRIVQSQPQKLGPALTLENAGGGGGSSSAIFFKTFPTGNSDATSAIVAHDDNNFSNSLYFQFKTPGVSTNSLVTQATLNSQGLTVEGTITGTGMVPPAAIVMQSGDINGKYDASGKGLPGTPYNGWAVCNGQNGTPDLRDRFIVGAGNDAQPGQAGGPDQHSHMIDAPAQVFGTTQDGNHHHGMPSAWYNRNLSCGCHTGIDTNATDVTRDVTQDNGTHGHQVTVNLKPFHSQPSSDLNRPKYYALYFIMRLA